MICVNYISMKQQKGYGAFGVGKSVRCLLAASLVLEDHESDMTTALAGGSSAVTQAIVEELVLILISILITTIIISSSNSSNH